MRVKLQIGQARVDAEGELEEIQKVLTDFWLPVFEGNSAYLGQPSQKPAEVDRPKKKRQKRPSTARSDGENYNKQNLDGAEIANRIKTHPEFSKIKAKILDVPADWINKCKLVAYIANEPITSGDVHRTLQKLKIKSNLPTLSRNLSSNNSDFLTEGENPVKYDLTVHAKTNFETWLNSSDE